MFDVQVAKFEVRSVGKARKIVDENDNLGEKKLMVE
jgi:hypothetical protein